VISSLSPKILRALEAVVYIALHHGIRPVSGKTLAEWQNLPPRYLERSLQRLVHEGVLRSVRGPAGGYVLARERRRISAGEIYRVVMELDAAEAETSLTPLGSAVVAPIGFMAADGLFSFLNTVTLANLCEQAVAEGFLPMPQQRLAAALQARQDFVI
jgi:Rrf2 family protein